MTVPAVHVVVLNWNLRDETISCVDSILAQEGCSCATAIVDNGSIDGSSEAFRSKWGSAVAVIRNPTNVGFAAGMNIGIRHALRGTADWILVLNNDTVAAPDMVSRLLDGACSDPTIAILSPAIYHHSSPDRLWRLGDRRLRWLPVPRKIEGRRVARIPLLRLDYVPGTAMLVHRQVFERVGLFDEGSFMYFEDADLCRRATDAGFGIACVTAARLWHKVSLSARRDPPAALYHRVKGKVRFLRGHAHGPSPLLTDAYLLFDLAVRLVRSAVQGAWPELIACVRGFRDGWSDSRESDPNDE